MKKKCGFFSSLVLSNDCTLVCTEPDRRHAVPGMPELGKPEPSTLVCTERRDRIRLS